VYALCVAQMVVQHAVYLVAYALLIPARDALYGVIVTPVVLMMLRHHRCKWYAMAAKKSVLGVVNLYQ
jgi:hypothetical protein